MRPLAIALVHHPVLDGQGSVVTTAVTNLDVHDLARSAKTYGCTDYFVVHPILAQRELVEKIRAHWMEGSSGKRIPTRKEALSLLRVVAGLDEVYERFGGRDAVEVWVTAARDVGKALSFADARARLASPGKPVLVVFGTGWGLARAVIDGAEAALEPVRSEASTYNHLSVRAACAIVLDRLRGERSEKR
jgi:hypothetical protein